MKMNLHVTRELLRQGHWGLGGGAPPTPPPLPPLKGAPGISPWLMGFEVLVLVVHLLLVLLVDLVVLDLDLLPQS